MLLSVDEVAKQFGFSEQYIRKLIRQGKISAERVGNTWAIPHDAIDNIGPEDLKKASLKISDRKGSRKHSKSKLNAISFFSGAMGLDIGLEKAGINILLACEMDEASRKTIISNDKEVGLIGNILNYSLPEILSFGNLNTTKDVDIIVGGPPCQAFSTAGKRSGFADARGNVFLKFIEIITQIKPKYAVIENVRGLLSMPMTIDIQDEVIEGLEFDPKKVSGSALVYIQKKLEHAGYDVSFNLYNSANYGVPQIRERVVIICSLQNGKVPYLAPTNSEDASFKLPKWKTFKDSIEGLPTEPCDHINFSEKRLQYIKMLKPGQNWRDLPTELQPIAMGNSYKLGGGKTGFYRRLSWDRPSPTLVTHPAMPATELAHPIQNRPLSVQEYKRVQQFPDDWLLQGTIIDQYRQIGNAVPVGLGTAIGKAIIDHHKGKKINEILNFPYSRYKNTSDKDFSNNKNNHNQKPNKNKANSKVQVPEFDFTNGN